MGNKHITKRDGKTRAHAETNGKHQCTHDLCMQLASIGHCYSVFAILFHLKGCLALRCRDLRPMSPSTYLNKLMSRTSRVRYILFRILIPVKLYLLVTTTLRFMEAARSSTMDHHPAPTPAGGQELRDPMQPQMPSIPFTPPLWKARANGEHLQGRNNNPTGRTSASLYLAAALRPPAQQ